MLSWNSNRMLRMAAANFGCFLVLRQPSLMRRELISRSVGPVSVPVPVLVGVAVVVILGYTLCLFVFFMLCGEARHT